MALALQMGTFAYQYVNSWLHPTTTKAPTGLKLGVISSAQINPAAGKYIIIVIIIIHDIANVFRKVIHPAETHPDVILHGIASRDRKTAQEAAKKYHFAKAYSSYQALLDDPEIDIVYVSTPNALHFEWSAKALRAGKHVLCEKPFTANAAEAKELVELAREKGLVCEEAVCVSLLVSFLAFCL
jgi:hypothetical protein